MKPNSLTACAAALLSLSLAGGLLAQERAPKKAQKKTEAAQRAPKAIPAPAAPAVQKARVVPMGLGAGREEEAKEEDPEAALLGTLLLPESANLNRILGRAADFFARDQWEEGCEVLQDLLEGRAIEAGPEQLDDPAYSVYSEDLRLYIPFTRYCQRLLCTLPPEGLEVYRLRVDAKAKEALNAARETMDVGALARAVELYFATSHGPELVMLLAELATLRAEIERALHLRSRLLIDYPDLSEELRRSIRIRQLHGLALLGEGAAFAEEHARLLALEPEGSTRIAGELVPFDKLPEHPAFRIRESYERRDAVAAELPLGTLQLMPLWEFELNDQDPYGISHKKSNNNNVFFSSSRGGLEVPARKSFRPGLRLLPAVEKGEKPILVFKDHDRLVVLDAVSGKLTHEALVGTSRDRSSSGGNRTLHVRTGATDYGTFAVTREGDRIYFTIENRVQQGTSSAHPYRNRLVCYDLAAGKPVWITEQNPGSGERLFFQTPPVRYRDRLYAPVRKGQAFCIASLDADSGEVLSVVNVHSGGTTFVRVPAQRPQILGDMLLHSTNAGAVAAFRLPDLELRWLRRYETRTPHQPPKKQRKITMRGFGYRVQERNLDQWKPVRPIAHRGRIVIAPVDSDALLCLDAQTGAMRWMLPRLERGYRNSEFEELVGVDGDRLYIAGVHLQCIDIVSGKRLWEKALSTWMGAGRQGRGLLHGGRIYLPDQGEVHCFAAESGEHLGKVALVPIVTGEKAPSEPVNLEISGGILFAATDDRVRAYAVPEDLIVGAVSGLEKVRRMVAVHRVVGAIEELRHLLVQRVMQGEELRHAKELLVRLTGEVAEGELDERGAEAAFATLDRCEETLRKAGLDADPRLLLFRMELSERLGRDAEVLELRERLLSTPIEEAK
jgi:outer membrane protein assembly factor BamB